MDFHATVIARLDSKDRDAERKGLELPLGFVKQALAIPRLHLFGTTVLWLAF